VHFEETQPVITRQSVEDNLEVANECFAQATIRLSDMAIDDGDGRGHDLPPELLNGTEVTTAVPYNNLTDDEQALVALKDNDENSIDVFYVPSFSNIAARGIARPVFANNTGNDDAENYVLIDPSRDLFTVSHKLLHVLLNSGHRQNEPNTAVFHSPTSANNAVDATKRIGPYPDATNAGVGANDTTDIRGNAENLP